MREIQDSAGSSYWSSVVDRLSSPNATNPHHDRQVAELNHYLESRRLIATVRGHFTRQLGALTTLDVGAGLGRFCAVAAQFGHVDALEPSRMAERLRARFTRHGNVTVMEETVESFTPRQPYDLIIVSGVFMELSDEKVRSIIGKLSRGLKPGGLVFVRDLISPVDKRTHGTPPYIHYSRPLSFWSDLFCGSGLSLKLWRYSHNPYLLFYAGSKLPVIRPFVRLLYSRPFYPFHKGLNALLAPGWAVLGSALRQPRMGLFFASKKPY